VLPFFKLLSYSTNQYLILVTRTLIIFVNFHLKIENSIMHKILLNLSTQSLGHLYVKKNRKLGYIKSSVYLGGLVGLIFFSFIMDNQGRRTSMLSSWGATTFGSFLITFSSNIYIICLGLFLTGASLSAIRLTISIIN
jgi:MFS family permease